MRTYLFPGTVIPVTGEGATRQVYIEQVIGEGASCIVYDGFFVDVPGVKERCRLKECYPLDAKVVRQGDRLVWSDPAERLSAQKRFQSIRQISFDMRYNPEVGNQITKSGYYENGDNFYLIMDINHGQTLDKENTGDINRILKIALKLTQLVGKLHNLGCRYLDLKPDNILVSNDPDPDIWLFDFDSLAPMDNSNTVSYSKGWAAPELVQGKFSSLCNATDLYSIGAILFHKIMGRSVTNDDIGLFAGWDFDGEIFDNVNPKVHRYLREIFKKTLAASVKRRYQNADELSTILELAVHATSGVPFIQTESIFSTVNFIGRENELREIDQAFEDGNRVVILHGFSGLGKSELAKAYAQQSRKYDITLFVRYGKECSSIAEWMENLHIENFEATGKERAQKAKALFDENTLIILDNFNIKPGKDNGIVDLLRTKARVLVTTTTDFSDIYRNNVRQIEIGTLSAKELQQLFESNAGIKIDDNSSPVFRMLLKAVEHHTYFVDLLARQLYLSGSSLNRLCQEVQIGIAATKNPTYVESIKDDNWYEDTIANIMRVLFKISNLSEGQQQVLRNMCLLNFVQMTRSAYAEITASRNLNDFNTLVRLGYIQENGGVFSIHALLSDLIREDMTPCWDNCLSVFNYALRTVNWFDQYGEFTLADQDEADIKGIFLYRFFSMLDFCQEENVRLCLKWVRHLFEGDFFIADIANPHIRFVQVFSLLDMAAQTAMPKLRFEIYFSLFKVWLGHCKYCSVVESEDDYKELSMRQQEAIKYYHLALKSAHGFDGSLSLEYERDIYVEIAAIVDETFMSRRMIEQSCPNLTCEDHFLIEPGIPGDLVRHSYSAYPECFKLSTWDKKYYGIPLSEDDLNEEPYDFDAWGTSDLEDDEWLRKTKAIEEDYHASADRLQFLIGLRENDGYDAAQKVSLLDYLLDIIFDPILMVRSRKNIEKTKQHIQRMDWKYAEWLLDIQREIVFDNSDFEWCDADEEYLSHIPKYRAVLAVIFDYDSFDDWMERVQDVDNRYAEYKTSTGFGHSVYEVATACWCLDKCNLILPYLMIELGDQLPAPEEPDYQESIRECYDMIATIADYAEKASLEIIETDARREEFLQIQKTSKHLMDMITGKRFEIKPEEDD